MAYHVPVLPTECVEGLNIKPGGTYADLTFGGGGHSRLILEKLNRRGRLFAFDQDEDALANTIDDKRFTLIRGNFRHFRNFLRYHGVERVDGILADLGVSSFHLDSAERGFSFRFVGPLDMRMNRQASLSAKTVVNEYGAEELARIFRLYGELAEAKRFAGIICRERLRNPIETVEALAELLGASVAPKVKHKTLAQAFQAIRIEVNHELDALKDMVRSAERSLVQGGRLVVVAYHSLEDRLVKNYLRNGNFEGSDNPDFMGRRTVPFEQVNRKVIVPTREEVERNGRARSAKLRIGSRL